MKKGCLLPISVIVLIAAGIYYRIYKISPSLATEDIAESYEDSLKLEKSDVFEMSTYPFKKQNPYSSDRVKSRHWIADSAFFYDNRYPLREVNPYPESHNHYYDWKEDSTVYKRELLDKQ